MQSGGVHVPFELPVWASIVAAACGAGLPFAALHSEAAIERRRARAIVGSYLDLVVLALAGGMGIEGALHAASEISTDPISARIASALALARDAGARPWDALAKLGADLGVSELAELAAAVSLAGQEGARIRASLAAKAGSIRRHRLAEAEAEANSTTERLFIPGVFLLAGFLVFVGYPALSRVLGGF
jgi:Flp pilus assembly protein TadB